VSLLHDIAAFASQQQMLTGLVGATLAGGVLFGLRQVPARGWALLQEAASVTLIVDSDDPVYAHVSLWLARSQASAKARRLMLTEAYDYERGSWEWEITLGAGWHVLRIGGGWMFVHRHVQEADALARAVGGGRRERLTLISIGRSQRDLRELMRSAKDLYFGGDRVQVLFWAGGGYQVADKRPHRPLDTVFLPEAQKARLVADMRRFIAAREDYRRRGVPWRRGYLLEGPPGTGKTTLIHVLAGLVGRSIYVVNPSNLSGDNELLMAVNAVGQDGVLVFEDIDSLRVTRDRDLTAAAETAATASGVMIGPEQRRAVTLSGLLNAIDGVTAREGRILFLTSNHAADLDPALLRPGRVDVREMIDRLGEAEAWAMYRAWRPEGTRSAFAVAVAGRLPISGSEMQGLLLAEEPAASPGLGVVGKGVAA
jgi:chaperone BCS1